MRNVAIVEDEREASDLLRQYLERYAEESGGRERFNVTVYDNAVNFLTYYKGNFDIVFMDIEMPDLNGMEAAAKLRELDKSVILIFVTNMAQYAVKGYEVSALDFVVKPVSYTNFALKLTRAIDQLSLNGEKKIYVSGDDGLCVIRTTTLKYVEIMNHAIIFHTTEKDIKSYGNLRKVEEMLRGAPFVRCNSCYLVNLKYVTSVKNFVAVVGGDELQISHSKRKEFLAAIADYLGGTY